MVPALCYFSEEVGGSRRGYGLRKVKSAGGLDLQNLQCLDTAGETGQLDCCHLPATPTSGELKGAWSEVKVTVESAGAWVAPLKVTP